MASADSWGETPTGARHLQEAGGTDALRRPSKQHLEWNAGKTADPQAQMEGIERCGQEPSVTVSMCVLAHQLGLQQPVEVCQP